MKRTASEVARLRVSPWATRMCLHSSDVPATRLAVAAIASTLVYRAGRPDQRWRRPVVRRWAALAAECGGCRVLPERRWTQVLRQRPDARFTVVGRQRRSVVCDRTSRRHVRRLRGRCEPSLRPPPDCRSANIVGLRVKILDAMAHALPVVSMTIGCEGSGRATARTF